MDTDFVVRRRDETGVFEYETHIDITMRKGSIPQEVREKIEEASDEFNARVEGAFEDYEEEEV